MCACWWSLRHEKETHDRVKETYDRVKATHYRVKETAHACLGSLNFKALPRITKTNISAPVF